MTFLLILFACEVAAPSRPSRGECGSERDCDTGEICCPNPDIGPQCTPAPDATPGQVCVIITAGGATYTADPL